MAVGVIRRPFGRDGQVFVHPDPDLDDPFPVGDVYQAAPDVAGGQPSARPLTVAASMLHSGRRIVRFEGIEDRESAAGLRDLVLSRDAARGDLDQDGFWAEDLLGWPVLDQHDRPLGTLREVRDGVAHDYLVVGRLGGSDVLVPAVAELVDIQSDRIVVQAVPGLFDDPDPLTDDV